MGDKKSAREFRGCVGMCVGSGPNLWGGIRLKLLPHKEQSLLFSWSWGKVDIILMKKYD